MPELTIKMEELKSYHALEGEDKALVEEALAKLSHAHAPYSRFHVAAALRTSSGKCWVGTNQENASYPVGICAERVALGISANLSPGEAITALAIVYADRGTPGRHPLAPCGMCRQAIHEQRLRQSGPIRLILATESGPTWSCSDADQLLPFSFSFEEAERR